MFVYRLLSICVVAVTAATAIKADPTASAQSAVSPAGTTSKAGAPTKARHNATRAEELTPEDRSITFNSVHVDGPYIAMTFDDGPSATLTPKLLDLLAAHHIKATFFVIGENVAEHPEIVARAAREGHEIASHSWSHPNLGKMSDEGVRSQLQRTDDAIKSATGARPALMRPPYGSITAHQKRWIHDNFGYRVILWDVDPLDWKRPGPAVVRSRILKETRPGSIVLSHDIHPGTIEAMPSTLDELEGKGLKFVTVSELIRLQTPETPRPTAQPRAKVATSASPASLQSPTAIPQTSVAASPTPSPSR